MKLNSILGALVLSASAASAGTVPVVVDGKPLGEAVVIEGVPHFDVAAITGANGMARARGWRLDGAVLSASSQGSGTPASLAVQRDGVVSRRVRTVEGRALVPVDDVAQALGGHVHTGSKDGVLRVSTVSRCDFCVLAPKPSNRGL